MRIIFTSDWQTDENNLDRCEIAMRDLLKACAVHKPDAVVFGGDLKQAYSPVSVRVVKFWVQAIRTLCAKSFRVMVLKGNHDRISQSALSSDWLSVLQAAGAEVYPKPCWVRAGDGVVFLLPYTGDKTEEREWAAHLANQARRLQYTDTALDEGNPGIPVPSVLCFHTELEGEVPGIAGLPLSTLGNTHYTLCMGGHIHRYHRVKDNVFYCGSPFAHDWSEANQQKGFLVIDISRTDYGLTFVPTYRIPLWYDAAYIEDHGIKPGPGSLIRVRVPVAPGTVAEQLRGAEAKYQNAFPGTRIHALPVVQQPVQPEILSGVTDAELIQSYIRHQESDAYGVKLLSGVDKAEAGDYIGSVLGKAPAARRGALRFISVRADNVLCFRDVTVPLTGLGLVLLTGCDRTWGGRSNGAGKTSLLSLLLVALYGQNTKDQRAGEWAREGYQGKSRIEIELEDGQGRKIRVVRTRPHGLSVFVDGRDISQGITGTRKGETQTLIDDIVADQVSLRNAVYIDQTVANSFVFGTQKDRMDLVSKICDLSRYEMAAKEVVRHLSDADAEVSAAQHEHTRLTSRIETLEAALADLRKVRENAVSGLWSARLAEESAKLEVCASLVAGLEDRQADMNCVREAVLAALRKSQDLQSALTAANARQLAAEDMERKSAALIKAGRCGTCGQPAGEIGQRGRDEAKALRAEAAKEVENLQAEYAQAADLNRISQEEYNDYREALRQAKSNLQAQRAVTNQAMDAAREEAERESVMLRQITDQESKVAETRAALSTNQQLSDTLRCRKAMLTFALSAVKRSGIPLYLSSTLCSFLNTAAQEYSEMFSGGRIGLIFSVTDGDFCVHIVNRTGSSETKGQSVGESAMAGIIAAFALRDAAAPTNLLVLDEPGSGLDPAGCRMLAEGLRRVAAAGRADSIIVTTHSPVIEAALAGETVWTAVKENGISRLAMEKVV